MFEFLRIFVVFASTCTGHASLHANDQLVLHEDSHVSVEFRRKPCNWIAKITENGSIQVQG